MPGPASARLMPPATTSLGSVAVPQAPLGLAVSRVGDRVGWAWGVGGSGHMSPRAVPRNLMPRGSHGGDSGSLFRGWARTDPSTCTPACRPGTFGENCGQKCQCPSKNQACHPASGACVCAAGYHGASCRQRECCRAPRPPSGRPPCGCRVGGRPSPAAPQPLAAGPPPQGVLPGALGPVASSCVNVSTGAPATLPRGPATALLASSAPTAASVSGWLRGALPWGRGLTPVCGEDSP